MANYTMEIREMINNPVINGVFTFDYPFYNDNIEDKKEFEELFEKYFYFREIGFETPDRFKMKLESKLKLIMPYYRQLALTEWNKVKTVELMMNSKNLTETTTHEQTLSGTSTNSGTSTSSINQSTNGSNNSTLSQSSKESRLENGVSSVSLSDGYLTGVSESSQTTTDTNSNEGTQSGTSEEQATTNTNQTITDTTTFTSKGDIGIQTPAYAIAEWRKVIINLNEQIIKECEDLFMKIY